MDISFVFNNLDQNVKGRYALFKVHGSDLFFREGLTCLLKQVSSSFPDVGADKNNIPDIWVMSQRCLEETVLFVKNKEKNKVYLVFCNENQMRLLRDTPSVTFCIFFLVTDSVNSIRFRLNKIMQNLTMGLDIVFNQQKRLVLTALEVYITNLIIGGHSTRTIQEITNRSDKCISYYKRCLMSKINVHSTYELITKLRLLNACNDGRYDTLDEI